MKAIRYLPLAAIVLGGPMAVAQDISQPTAREKAVADLGRLTAPAQLAPVVAPKVDPFAPPESNLKELATQAPDGEMVRRNDEALVADLAKRIQPTGMMMLGGEPSLMFTERRQKIGDKLTVQLDGVEYVVEIVSIANNRFRIRYNDKEAERTIK